MAETAKLPEESILPKLFNVKDLEHKSSPDFMRVYANSANFGLNFYDLTIVFGEMVSDADANGMHIENRVAVTMSLEHARALSDALQKTLEIYESSHHAKIRKAPGPMPTLEEVPKLNEGSPKA